MRRVATPRSRNLSLMTGSAGMSADNVYCNRETRHKERAMLKTILMPLIAAAVWLCSTPLPSYG